MGRMDGRNFVNYNIRRERDERVNVAFERQMYVNDPFISRLGLEKELESHNGCVNCLEWNEGGNILASGSDDCQIILWDPFRYKKLKCIQSGHQGNIFSVKFLPNSNSNTIASGAADFKIRVHDINLNDPVMVCSCHINRVKRLAVAPNVPFMFWSAAEDGLILQYDLRQRHRCSNICNNVLINLLTHMGTSGEAKCLAINPLRPELLAVGANDPYVRLYDRRMISNTVYKQRNDVYSSAFVWDRNRQSPLNSSDNETEDDIHTVPPSNLPQGCAAYFVAGHLPLKRQDYRRKYRTLASTYLAFSPDGSELLVNLGGEQIYLFDILRPNKPQAFNFNSNVNDCAKNESTHMTSNGYKNGTTNGIRDSSSHVRSHSCKSNLPPEVEDIKQKANHQFDSGQYTHAIRLYNKAILICPTSAILHGNRAQAYIKRNWDGDRYAALRDCSTALKLDPNYLKAHFRLARCLFELQWNKEAFECIQAFKAKYPEQLQTPAFSALDQDITNAINTIKKDNCCCTSGSNDHAKTQNSEPLEHTSFLNNNSIPSTSNNNSSNHSSNSSSPSSSVSYIISDQEKEWRSLAFDYMSRFCGHCNTTTDIKEANFFGSNGQYIVAGSDDGSFFTWDRKTTNCIRVLKGDESIVNCLQPHPSQCLLATSGIDHVVRLWSPRPEDGSKDEREVSDSEDAAIANQRRMNADPLETILMNMGYRLPGMFNPDEDDNNESRDGNVVHCRTS